MGRGVMRALVWAAASLSLILATACGGDDDGGLPPFEPTDAAGDTLPGDASAKRDAVSESSAPADTSSPVRDAGADAADSSADRATQSDARDSGPVADVNRDAADASRPPDAAPDSARPDVGSDVGPDIGPDTALDVRTPDALPDLTPVPDVADVAQPPDAAPDAVEASPDSAGSEAGPDSTVLPDAQTDAGDETAAGDAQDDGTAEGGGLALRSWQVGSDPICSTGEDAGCMADLATNTFAVSEHAGSTVLCPMAPSDARLWFMETGAPPVDGDYAVMAAASDVDVPNVGPGQVVVEIIGTLPTAAAWWAQSGTVHVETQGTDLTFTFQNLAASDGTNPTTLSGHMSCTPL